MLFMILHVISTLLILTSSVWLLEPIVLRKSFRIGHSWPSLLLILRVPFGGPGPGLLEWNEDGSVMIERAPSGAYVEEWHRVPGSADRLVEHRTDSR